MLLFMFYYYASKHLVCHALFISPLNSLSFLLKVKALQSANHCTLFILNLSCATLSHLCFLELPFPPVYFGFYLVVFCSLCTNNPFNLLKLNYCIPGSAWPSGAE